MGKLRLTHSEFRKLQGDESLISAAVLSHSSSLTHPSILCGLSFKMSLDFKLTSSTSGAVFKSTYSAIDDEIVPETRLEPSHPFNELWQDHLAELIDSESGLYDAVIDALADLAGGMATSHTLQTKRGVIRELLATHPPDVVVVGGLSGHGCHVRSENLWPFICVSNADVAQWCTQQDPRVKLAQMVVLKATLDHELGHWARTLVSTGVHHYMHQQSLFFVYSKL